MVNNTVHIADEPEFLIEIKRVFHISSYSRAAESPDRAGDETDGQLFGSVPQFHIRYPPVRCGVYPKGK
ncbi:hypothetical protein I4200191B4_07450 [Pseudoflavonifractor gallinarum]